MVAARTLMDAGFGTTVDRFRVYAEYAPQAGRSFRDNSNVHVHSGLLELAFGRGAQDGGGQRTGARHVGLVTYRRGAGP